MGQEAWKLHLVVAEEVIRTDRRSEARAKAGETAQPERRARASATDRRGGTRNAPGFRSKRGEKLSMGLTKAELIEKYRYKVRLIAISMARGLPSSVEVDDLISVGYMGLMDAGDRFDPKRGVKFETFSALRIRGAIMDELRNMDWIPRSARDRVNEIQAARETVKARTGEVATSGEMSQQMDISLEKLQQLMRDLGSVGLVNIEDLPESYEPESSAETNPFAEAVRGELKTMVARVLSELTERERTVLNCYYYRGLGVKEISQILDVTESRISQIHTQAITELRRRLKSQPASVESVLLSLIEE
jgi:RNA polymerase sigma factor FliA